MFLNFNMLHVLDLQRHVSHSEKNIDQIIYWRKIYVSVGGIS